MRWRWWCVVCVEGGGQSNRTAATKAANKLSLADTSSAATASPPLVGGAFEIAPDTGPVVAGNLGSKTRMKYAVIGDTVNVAARLEALNKEYGTTILLSDEVKTRLPNDLRELSKKVGITVVKGRQQTVISYSV